MSGSKKNCFLGIDTSNYTTSVGIWTEDGEFVNSRKLLPVPAGSCGLRQSDALFNHVKQFPAVFAAADTGKYSIKGIGVSSRPRNVEGSYMPCFLYGVSAAQTLAAAYSVPIAEFSHQQGHIAAGIFSAGREDLFSRPFYAFHVSGGTTELLRVDSADSISVAAATLDISLGQLVDRTGVLLGLGFPCGKALESLAAGGKSPGRSGVKLKDGNCCLSGYENKVMSMRGAGVPGADIARYVLEVAADTVTEMIRYVNRDHLPVLAVGGVMSDMIIRDAVSGKLSDFDICYADAALSSDNAVGIAYLAGRKFL